MENVSTTSEIFQSHRIADMQSFVVVTKIARITEYRLCMTIVATILKKRSNCMKWNKISDGLPPIGYPVIVTIKDNLRFGLNELRYPVYYERSRNNNSFHWSWRFGDMEYELIPDVSEVIAWAKIPEPYEENLCDE